MFPTGLTLRCPGLFVTGTDTAVGKTVVACAVIAALREQLGAGGGAGSARVAACKPVASGCRVEGGELVNDDALALARFANAGQSLDSVNPIRYLEPLAPAVAAEVSGAPLDVARLAEGLDAAAASGDALVVEGVGGVMVPLDGQHTVLDLAAAIGYPVVVVARAGLGTLNHTAMTVRLLRGAGCHVVGLVVNGVPAEGSDAAQDVSVSSNPHWLARMNDVPILAAVPACPGGGVDVAAGRLPDAVVGAVAGTYWPALLSAPPGSGSSV